MRTGLPKGCEDNELDAHEFAERSERCQEMVRALIEINQNVECVGLREVHHPEDPYSGRCSGNTSGGAKKKLDSLRVEALHELAELGSSTK
eukprot:SAG11_NODE_48_length_20030_cov_232.459084_3_plen_91_part_00